MQITLTAETSGNQWQQKNSYVCQLIDATLTELFILVLYSKSFLPSVVFIIYSVSLYLLYVINELLSSEGDWMPGIMAAKFCNLIILFLSGIFKYVMHWRCSSSFKYLVNLSRSIFQNLSLTKNNNWQHHFITKNKQEKYKPVFK